MESVRRLPQRPAAVMRFWALPLLSSVQSVRATSRYQPYDSGFDPDDLQEAREWKKGFEKSRLPKGQTSYSRSSGPGGQNVNKVETKATTFFPVSALLPLLPKLMHKGVVSSRYYARRSNALVFHAEAHRTRSANAEENVRKLWEELEEVYRKWVPNEQSREKRRKYEELAKHATKARLEYKRSHSRKKRMRKGGGGGGSDI